MLIQFALTITALLAFCGLAIDVGLLALKKIQLQTAADAAAVGASYQFGLTAETAEAIADASLNGFTNGTNNVAVTVTSPPTTGAYTTNPAAIQATVSQVVQPYFFSPKATLSAEATAIGSRYCVYLFSQSFTNTDSLSLGIGNVQGNCPFYLGLGYSLQSGTSTGAPIYVASTSANSSGSVTPPPVFNVPRANDPLAYLPVSVPGTCAQVPAASGGSVILNPGTYCGGLSFSGTDVTLNPGLYIITGSFSMSGHSLGAHSLSGSGVTIYMTKDSSNGYGTISLVNANAISLSAPTSGPYEGILIFTDRNMPAQQALAFKNGGSSPAMLDGVLYMINQQISAGNTSLSCNNYLEIVADSLSTGIGGLTVKSDYSSLPDGNPIHGFGMVE